MAFPPRVVISLLNWNAAEVVLRGIFAISSLDYAKFATIVVDNASTDDSVQRIRAAYPDLKIIVSSQNNGYAAGNALALEVALAENADLFWILNPDASVVPDTLTELVAAYQRGGEALYGSVPLHRDGESQAWQVTHNTWILDENGLPDLGRPLHIDGAYTECFENTSARPSATLSGSSLLIPLSLVRKHGFIDTSFFLYSEESDYSLRLWRKGVPSILVPTSIVYHQPQGAHKHHASLKPVIIYYQTRNRLVLLKRYASKIAYLVALLRHCLYVLAWALLAVRRGVAALSIAKYTLYGIRDAVRERMGKTYSPEQLLSR